MKKRRAELGITQAQLAERLGVAQGYISMIERGKKGWPESYADALARELQVLPSELADAAGRGKTDSEVTEALDRSTEIGRSIREKDAGIQRITEEFESYSDIEKLNMMTTLLDSLVGMTQLYMGARSTVNSIMDRLKAGLDEGRAENERNRG